MLENSRTLNIMFKNMILGSFRIGSAEAFGKVCPTNFENVELNQFNFKMLLLDFIFEVLYSARCDAIKIVPLQDYV